MHTNACRCSGHTLWKGYNGLASLFLAHWSSAATLPSAKTLKKPALVFYRTLSNLAATFQWFIDFIFLRGHHEIHGPQSALHWERWFWWPCRAHTLLVPSLCLSLSCFNWGTASALFRSDYVLPACGEGSALLPWVRTSSPLAEARHFIMKELEFTTVIFNPFHLTAVAFLQGGGGSYVAGAWVPV